MLANYSKSWKEGKRDDEEKGRKREMIFFKINTEICTLH